MFINGKFCTITLCTKCDRRHPKEITCIEYDEILVGRELQRLKTMMLQHMVAPTVYRKPPDNIVFMLRGRKYNLSQMLKDSS